MFGHHWSACAFDAGTMRREPRVTRRAGRSCVVCSLRWLIVVTLLAASHSVHAHGIVGNRLFPGTLAFDDPAVMDELIVPAFSSLKHPGEGGDVIDDRIGWSFMRLLTPTLAFGIESGWIHRNLGLSNRSGFDTTNLGLKGLLYKNELHEVMISAGLAWELGRSGAAGVAASRPGTLQPGIFFGKGFGDLPDSLAWLRPFAITGAVTLEHPMSGTSINVGIDPQTGQLGPTFTRDVDTLHWGFSIQYSTYYLTSRFTPGKIPKEEPLHQFVPLVEFAFDTPRGEKTAATVNPGLAYAAATWQVAAEAIVPLNSEGGRTIGVRAQLLLFLDDLMPTIFGKPLLESITQAPQQSGVGRRQ
jgi:hypothetical protein